MKTFSRFFALAAAGFASLCLAPVHGLAAPNSPVGNDWDLLASGGHRGVMLISFSGDNTLVGTKLLRPTAASTGSPNLDPRHPAGEAPRDPLNPPSDGGGSTNSTPTKTNFFGGADLTGMWSFDDCGRVIGFMQELTGSVTNVPVYTTNGAVITTNYMQIPITITNGANFRALVSKPGTSKAHLTLKTYNRQGATLFTGGALINLAPITGQFSATGMRPSVYIEFFDLFPALGSPNTYVISGSGATYDFQGYAILSRQKYLTLYTAYSTNNQVYAAYSGPFNSARKSGSLIGTDGIKDRIKYIINHRP